VIRALPQDRAHADGCHPLRIQARITTTSLSSFTSTNKSFLLLFFKKEALSA
jgi:hypothetical protein